MENRRTLSSKIDFSKVYLYDILSILLITYPVFYPANDILVHLGQFGLFFLWFFVALTRKNNILSSIFIDSGIYSIFYIIILIRIFMSSNFSEKGFDSPNRLMTQFIIILFYYIFAKYNLKYSNKEKNLIYTKSFLIAYNISAIINIIYLLNDPYTIRGSLGIDYFAGGDFNLVYTGVLISAILLYIYVKLKVRSLLYTGSLAISTVLVLLANYTIAMLLLVIMWLIVLITIVLENRIVKFVFPVLLLLGIPIVFTILPNIFFELSKSELFPFAIQNRFSDIALLLTGNSSMNSGALDARFYRLNTSIDSFIENPIFGINFKNYNFSTIGNHTQWPDNLARFGIIGTSVLLVQYLIWYLMLKSFASNKHSYVLFKISFLLYFILGFLNNNMLPGMFILMFHSSIVIGNGLSPESEDNID